MRRARPPRVGWGGQVSSAEDILKATAGPVLRLGLAIVEGRITSPADVARALLGVGLDLVPDVAELRGYLDDVDRARAEERFLEAKNRRWPDG